VGATDLITLEEARSALSFAASSTSHDTDLAGTYIPAVTAVIEDVTGPVVSRAFSQDFDGGSSVLVLPHFYVTVTQVDEDGVTLVDGTDYVVNGDAGMVYRGTSYSGGHWATGRGNITVAYTAGFAASTEAVPGTVKLAARLILATTWQRDQQGGRPAFGSVDQGMVTTPGGHRIPAIAWAYLEPYSDRMPAGSSA